MVHGTDLAAVLRQKCPRSCNWCHIGNQAAHTGTVLELFRTYKMSVLSGLGGAVFLTVCIVSFHTVRKVRLRKRVPPSCIADVEGV